MLKPNRKFKRRTNKQTNKKISRVYLIVVFSFFVNDANNYYFRFIYFFKLKFLNIEILFQGFRLILINYTNFNQKEF